jgi:hypothetical protein
MWAALAPALIQGGASLLGGVLSNNQKTASAAEANRFSAQQAQQQMDFQKEMSNTQYQRGVKDMKEAGLNPMLAYSQGGASAPNGAAATGVAVSNYDNLGESFNSGYNASRQTTSNVKKADQDIEKSKQDIKKSEQDVNTSSAQEAKLKEDTKKTIEETIKTVLDQKQTEAKTDNIKAELDNIKQMFQLLIQQTNTQKTQQRVNSAVAANTDQDTKIKVPQENFAGSKLGEYMPFLKGTLDLFSSAADAYSTIRGRRGSSTSTTTDSRGNSSTTRSNQR